MAKRLPIESLRFGEIARCRKLQSAKSVRWGTPRLVVPVGKVAEKCVPWSRRRLARSMRTMALLTTTPTRTTVPIPHSMDEIARLCAAVDRPVNGLAAGPYLKHSVADFAAAGV